MSSRASLNAIKYYPNSADWFVQLRHSAMPIWLDSGRPKSTYGRFDIISAAPAITLKTIGQQTFIQQGNESAISTENPFRLLQHYLPLSQTHVEQVPFCGGVLGYFGYDLGRRLEDLPELAQRDINLPDMCVGIYPWAIVQDHLTEKAWLVINRTLAPAYDFSEIAAICLPDEQKPSLQDSKCKINPISTPFKINEFSSNFSSSDYHSAIRKIHAYITDGDCYQVNFAQRFSANVEGDNFEAYLALRDSLPSPFSAYMELEDGAILSLSPERFIKLEQRRVETKPIKGTITRGNTPQEDATNAQTLQSSQKDRAENLMIVDLLRNDLSKTCVDIQVPELFGLQSFANVHHLVSTVTGILKPEKNALHLLSASFPGGSITGAPKIRAMEIIEELEPVRRSVYCGSLGYISSCGNMDTNIAIRTLIRDHNKMHCWGGGGIVADSEAHKEYQESIAKVKVLLDTLIQHFSS